MTTLQKAGYDAIEAFTRLINAVVAEAEKPSLKMSMADKMVDQYGEVVLRKTACEIMGRAYNTMMDLVRAGEIKVAPDGRIVTRSIAAYIERDPKAKKKAAI